jgi:YfiR/HmsC-like
MDQRISWTAWGRIPRWITECGLVILALMCGLRSARAAEMSEYDLKAAFVTSFVQFVNWPGGSGAPITIGILGDDPFRGALETQAKQAGSQSISIRRGRRIEDLKSCDIIFVARSERGRTAEIASALGNAPVLTIGDYDNFAREGGMIGFYLDGGKVRFEINQGAAKRAGLGLSSKLLRLGRIVGS